MLVVGLLPVAAVAADDEQAGDVKASEQVQVESSARNQTQVGRRLPTMKRQPLLRRWKLLSRQRISQILLLWPRRPQRTNR